MQQSATLQQKAKDYFKKDAKGIYAGLHIIVDLYEASRLNDIDHCKACMREIVAKTGATLLHIHCHVFCNPAYAAR